MENDAKLYQNMRSMISLIDKLRDFHLNDYISLPRIAVLGEQSAGKSSLLESIAGITFLPRGTGIVTRRPLELRMIREPVDKPYFVFPKDFNDRKFYDPKEVTSIIEELTDQVSGTGKQITNNPIICRIYSSQVPDLTLVDLPGVTRNPVGDQPENIEQITTDLVKEYCSNKDTIILCVIPANIDLANSHALKLDKQIDPQGERTLGVLTKIDLMDEGTNASETIQNETIKLKHGYIGVKGRSQADIQNNITMEAAIKKELDFFGKHPIYSTLPSNVLGTLSLIDKVSNLLYGLIQKSLPRIQNEIQKKLQSVKKHLKNIGEEFPSQDDDKMELVFQLVREFKEKFNQDLNGKYYYQKNKPNEDRETLTYKINNIFNELFIDYAAKDFKISKQYTDFEIMKSIQVYQGENIPGFQSFDSFLNLITPKLELIGQPILNALDECKIILEEKGIEIIEIIFKNYGVLNQKMKEIFGQILNNKKYNTLKIVQTIITCEENYLFTNDSAIMEPKPIIAKKDQSLENLRVQELRQKLDDYFAIIIRNLKEQIPKLIGKFLILDLNNSIQVEIMNSLNQVNYCIDSLVENKQNLTERERLKQEYVSLSKAENLLVNDFGMGFSVLPQLTDMGQQAQELMDEDGHVLDQEMIQNIHRINLDFLKLNQDFMNIEKQKIMKEYDLISQPMEQQTHNEQKLPSSRQTNHNIHQKRPQNITAHQQHSQIQQPPQTPNNLLSEKSIQEKNSMKGNISKQNSRIFQQEETVSPNKQMNDKKDMQNKFSMLDTFKKQREQQKSPSPITNRTSQLNLLRDESQRKIENNNNSRINRRDQEINGRENPPQQDIPQVNPSNRSNYNDSKNSNINEVVLQKSKLNNLFGGAQEQQIQKNQTPQVKRQTPKPARNNLYLDFLQFNSIHYNFLSSSFASVVSS